MDIPDWVQELFQTIDARDAEAFAAYLTETGCFRYGSQAPVVGRRAVAEHVAGFFFGLSGLRHELKGFWWGEADALCFVQGEVTYFLADGREVTLPFLNLFRMAGERIDDYRIYADPSPLFA